MGKSMDPNSQNIRSRKFSKWVIFLVFAILAAYLGVGGYTARVVTQVEEHPQFDKSPGSYGLEYEDIRFTAAEMKPGYQPGMPNEEATRAIILVHGRNASKQNAISGNLPKLGAELHDAGFAVLMIDLRAHGESEGKRYSYGVYERHDVLGAVDWLMGQGFSAGRMAFWGSHLGERPPLVPLPKSRDRRSCG